MAKGTEFAPTERPEPSRALSERLSKALDDAEARRRLTVELHISGGMPKQSFSFHFRAPGAGELQCEMRCALSGREGRLRKDTSLEQRDWMALLGTIHASRVLDLPLEAPRFQPDTVVGYLEISDGAERHRLYFVADEAQAKVQDRVPARQLMKVVDAIYELGSQLLQMPSVKP